jgi:putative flippase GtrA
VDRREHIAVFLRFLLVNVLNTALYWGLYLLLLQVTPYPVANALALVIAALVAYVGNARYAFKVDTSRRSLVLYLTTNGTTVALRMAVVWILVDVLSIHEALVPPLAVAVTTPIAFGLTRWAMGERPARRTGVPEARDRPARSAIAA